MKCNMGGTDRISKIVVGSSLVAFATYTSQIWAYVGIVPLLTGTVGFCPMYFIFKFNSGCNKH